MRWFFSLLLVMATSASATAVHAVTVSDTLVFATRETPMTYRFEGLAPSGGSSGLLTLDGAGLDIGSNPPEYMDVLVEGTDFGRWVCDSTPIPGASDIPGRTGTSRCDFTLPLTIGANELSGFLADGVFELSVLFGDGVAAGQDRRLTASLTYAELAPVPLPAGSVLLLTGLVGLGAAGGRRKP